MSDNKKLPSSQHPTRSVLVPPKTTIQFDTGIKTTTADAKSKPTSVYHRNNASRQRSAEKDGSRIETRIGTADTHATDALTTATSFRDSEVTENPEDKDILSSSNVEIFLSEAVIDAFFTQNSPSAGSLSVTPLTQQEVSHISKMRVVEEMSRIHQRAYVTEQQRQQYMQTALAMDAPRLARMILQDEIEHNEAMMPPPSLSLANPNTLAAVNNTASTSTNLSESVVLKSASTVSFLTAGELFLSDEHKGTETPPNNAHLSAQTTKPHSATSPDQSPPPFNNAPVRTHSFRKRQSEDDAKFCKAVEEVERIRKRFIQKASQPLLGSRSNVDQLNSTSLDMGSSSGSGGFGSSGGTGNSGGSGAKVKRNSFFGTRSSFNAGDLLSTAAAAVVSNINNINTTISGLGRAKDKSALSISTSNDSNDRDFPALSPGKGDHSPLRYLQQQHQQQTKSTVNKYAVTDPTLIDNTAVYGAHDEYRDADYRLHPEPLSPNVRKTAIVASVTAVAPTVHAAAVTSEVYVHNNKTLTPITRKSLRQQPASPLPNKNLNNTAYSFDTFDGYVQSAVVTGPADVCNNTISKQQAMVASSIDMLIGSRFNSDRDIDSGPQEILGSSLVLLQQQLDSAATEASPNNSYRNVHNNALATNVNSAKNVGTGAGGSTRISAAAATALATLRPSNGNRRINATAGMPGMQFETQYNSHDYAHEPHMKLQPLEIDHHGMHDHHNLQQGHAELHSDDSMGSSMFAFKVGSGSTHQISEPSSAERPTSKNNRHRYAPQEAQQSMEFGASFTTTTSLALSALSNETSPEQQQQKHAQSRGDGPSAVDQSRRNLFPLPDHPPAGGNTAAEDFGATLRTLRNSIGSGGSGFSTLSFTDSMFQSTGDSIASLAPHNLRQSSLQHPHNLAPLHLPARSSDQASTLTTPAAVETPVQLSARRSSGANNISEKPGNTANAQARSDARNGSRNAQVRLSSFELDVSAINNPSSTKSGAPTMGNVSSTRNSSTRNSTLNGSRNNKTGATGNSNTRAAKIRQNAQLLLTSPLSEWLTAGAHMHQQQLSGGLPTGHSSGPNTHSTPLLESVGPSSGVRSSDEPQKPRRNSKFTFDELQQADFQLGTQEDSADAAQPQVKEQLNNAASEKDSPTKTISPVKSARNNASHRRQGSNSNNAGTGSGLNSSRSKDTRKVESLPQLPQLPNLAHNASTDSLVRNSLYAYSSSADPTVVHNVYKSLNILNGCITQLTPSLSASQSDANYSDVPSVRVASIDQELDDLLTGNSEKVFAGPGRLGIGSTSNDSLGDSDRDTTAKQLHFKRALRPSRQNVLISQSVSEQGAAGGGSGAGAGGAPKANLRSSDGAIAETHHSALSMAGSAALLSMQNSATGANMNAEEARQLRHIDSKPRLLRPTQGNTTTTTSATPTSSDDGGSEGAHRRQYHGGASSSVSPEKRSRPPLSGNSSGNALNTLNSSIAKDGAPNQMQRLGALAAALEAGDAVGKLMAQMMLGGNSNAGNAGNATGAYASAGYSSGAYASGAFGSNVYSNATSGANSGLVSNIGSAANLQSNA